MKILKGKFTRHDDTPAAGARLELTLSQDAIAIDGTEVKSRELIEIVLNENGEIPPGKRIYGNDELVPRGTYYTATLYDDDPQRREYCEWLKIEGRSPINLNNLVPLETAPLPVHVAVEVAYPAPRVPASRQPGSTANHVGFFGVTVNYPADMGSTPVPSFDVSRAFGVCAFTLPLGAVVGCVSIIVDSADQSRDKQFLVGLYDADGNKVLAQPISVDAAGVATGEFESPVNLDAGDYFLAWAINRSSSTLMLRSIEVNHDQFRLANAGGGAIVAGSAQFPGGNGLPEALGEITLGPCSPPLVYFKA